MSNFASEPRADAFVQRSSPSHDERLGMMLDFLARHVAEHDLRAARWIGKDQSRLGPCAHCPSDQIGPTDPESEQILSESPEPFDCGWRPGVSCVGWNRRIADRASRRVGA